MTIKEAREFSGLTQVQVEEEFGIPVRSLQNWESGIRQAPDYVEAYLVEKLTQLKKVARIKVQDQEVRVETLEGDEWEPCSICPVVDGLIPLNVLISVGRLSEAGFKLVFM